MALIDFKSKEKNDLSRFDPLSPNTEIKYMPDMECRAKIDINWKDICEIFRSYEDIFSPGVLSSEDTRRALFENAEKLGFGAIDVNNLANSSTSVAPAADGKVNIEQFAKYISFELLKRKPDINPRSRLLRQHSAPPEPLNNPFESFTSSPRTRAQSNEQNSTNPFEQFETKTDRKAEAGKYVDTIYEHIEAFEKNQWKATNSGNPFDLPTFRGFDFDKSSESIEDEKNVNSPFKQEKDVFGLQLIAENKPVDSLDDKLKPQSSGDKGGDEKSSTSSSDSDVKAESSDEKRLQPNKANTNALLEMRRGTSMLKHGKYGFPHFRRFQISEDHQRFQWYSRRKSLSDTSVAISDMCEIVPGQTTDAFKKSDQMSSLMQASFSIIYGPKRKTVDLIAKSADESNLWLAGLKELLRSSRAGKDLSKLQFIDAGFVFKDVSRPGYSVKAVKERKSHRESLPTLGEQWRSDSAADILSPKFQRILRTNNFRIRGGKSQSVYEGNSKPKDISANKSQRKLIRKDLAKVKKAFEKLLSWSRSSKISTSVEFVTVSTLLAEFEQRIEDCEQMVDNLSLDLHVIKRDLWILKIDIYALDDFIIVLAG